MDEIFGEQNFVACIVWQKVYTLKNTAKYFSEDHDYVLVYAKKNAQSLIVIFVRAKNKQMKIIRTRIMTDEVRGFQMTLQHAITTV